MMFSLPHIQVVQVLEVLEHRLCYPLELVIADGELPQPEVVIQPPLSPGRQAVLAEVEHLNLGKRLEEVGVQRRLVLVLAPVTDPIPHQCTGNVQHPQVGQEQGYAPSLPGGTESDVSTY